MDDVWKASFSRPTDSPTDDESRREDDVRSDVASAGKASGAWSTSDHPRPSLPFSADHQLISRPAWGKPYSVCLRGTFQPYFCLGTLNPQEKFFYIRSTTCISLPTTRLSLCKFGPETSFLKFEPLKFSFPYLRHCLIFLFAYPSSSPFEHLDTSEKLYITLSWTSLLDASVSSERSYIIYYPFLLHTYLYNLKTAAEKRMCLTTLSGFLAGWSLKMDFLFRKYWFIRWHTFTRNFSFNSHYLNIIIYLLIFRIIYVFTYLFPFSQLLPS